MLILRNYIYFYPRSPCGERLDVGHEVDDSLIISIHVPLAGNVASASAAARSTLTFLSTFPLRGTSRAQTGCCRKITISIHVPLAGNVSKLRLQHPGAFTFLSTFPLRGTSTRPVTRLCPSRYFYPRSPCGERRHDANYLIRRLNFYPRSPCGERRKRLCASRRPNYISIHVPLAGNVG